MTGTYGDMQNRIADEIVRSDLSSQIKLAIQSAISFYEGERFWFSYAEATSPTVAQQQTYALPTDFLEATEMTYTDAQSIRILMNPRSYLYIRQRSLVTTAYSRPQDWAIEANEIWLYPIPDQVYTLTLSYIKQQATLSATGDTNNWMTDGEELIRSRAKADLFANVLYDVDRAAVMSQIEKAAYRNLLAKSRKKTTMGRLSFDGPGIHSAFNIYTGDSA